MYSVLLDTSFFIRLLNDEDPLHKNARDYFKYFLDQEVLIRISTISIAEYCVKGDIVDLPLRNVQIVPFNLDHAKKAGEFAEIIFTQRKISGINLQPRPIIPNDSKLFAQADCDGTTQYFVTSDARSQSTYSVLTSKITPRFKLIDISNPYNEVFGVLDL
jgi:hypothetical protein